MVVDTNSFMYSWGPWNTVAIKTMVVSPQGANPRFRDASGR
jgi:hypothetical protein